MAEIDKLTHNDLFYTEAEQEEWDRWERNSIEEDIKNTAMKEGFEQGIEQNTKETIIAMNKNNIPIDIISNITGKNIEEIKETLENNK